MKLFFLILALLAVGVAFLSIRLFFGKAFVKTHVDQSKAMRQRGIHCVQSQDAAARAQNPHRINEKNNHE